MSPHPIVAAATGDYGPPTRAGHCWVCLGLGLCPSAPQWICGECGGTGVLSVSVAGPATQAEEPET